MLSMFAVDQPRPPGCSWGSSRHPAPRSNRSVLANLLANAVDSLGLGLAIS
jgi:hypothetical protein